MSENLDLKIRAEMRKRRMTFKELAALIGISGAYLSDILNGNRDGNCERYFIGVWWQYAWCYCDVLDACKCSGGPSNGKERKVMK